LQQVITALTRRELNRLSLGGLTLPAKALVLTLVWQATERQFLILVDGNKEAEQLFELVDTFWHLLINRPDLQGPQLIPALDVLPTQKLSPHSEITEQRGIGLWRLAENRAPITITSISSALYRVENAEFYRQLAITLRKGEELPLDSLVQHLESIGYEKREPVEMVGEYSIRGGILDVFPAESEKPIRVEFFGDEIESIRRFDVASQRSVLKINEAAVLPLVEYPRSNRLFHEMGEKLDLDGMLVPGESFPGWEFAVPLLRPRPNTLLDLAPEALVILDEPEQIATASERFWKRLTQSGDDPRNEANYLGWDAFSAAMNARTQLAVRELQFGDQEPAIRTQPSMSFHGSMPVVASETKNLVQQGYRVAFFAPTTGELERMADILQEYSVPFQLAVNAGEQTSRYLSERAYIAGSVASTYLVKGNVRKGVLFPEARIAIVGSEDLFDTSEMVARPQSSKGSLSAFAADLADLKAGDYVVHTQHGVGRFLGLKEMTTGDQTGDFMLIEYADSAKLYVPLARMDLVQKYRGAGESAPPLDRLGGVTWTKTKSRVKAKMRDMAEELLKLYAQRRMAEGYSFSVDSNWQREFEDAFEFTETKDQLEAVKDIKRDMESTVPMDRLLCGDVGFGKTEVAMRAAFKALGDGKQVAVLAPTTVLAFQHFETFKRRFQPFPVRVDMLSRFRGTKELKATVEDVNAGKVDIVIGTHRLLSEDVKFHDLGLVVVDEEQRFGVRHKERLKHFRKNVDVLTLSATPIPRTLHMSLLGLRDMSVIETPPKDRLAIHTVVARFDPDLIKTAIEQELGRGGQVYFIHNRIQSIYDRAAMIRSLIPDVRIGVGHGQMSEGELEKILLGFMRHDFDVFVSTTIVENGIDIPLANTIIIENSERYGLSELYQLRGRVGRSNRRAYAYLLVPEDSELSEIARKRLAALREFSDLGAGFKIAALDLELRGAGNLLGGEQHGHIAAVGFDTYVRLLEETVRELKGEEVAPEVHSNLSLGLDLRIPPEYISDEQQRLRAYKRIADARNNEQVEKVLGELGDRYGTPPDEVKNLVLASRLKNQAESMGIELIDRRQGMINIKFHQQSRVNPERLMAIVAGTEGAQFTPAGVLRLPAMKLDNAGALLDYLSHRLSELQAVN
jgi:transcription-repair coupling factor (superfamily II helicase)